MSDDSLKTTVFKSAFEWLKGQPFNNVLILILITLLGYASLYLAPQHIQMIQTGYERIQASDVEARKADRETFRQTLEILTDRRNTVSIAKP